MYHTFFHPKTKLTQHQLRQYGQQLLEARTLKELAIFLKMEKHKLVLLAKNPVYQRFYVPKRKGGQRMIEHPEKNLKLTQKVLARAFQGIYLDLKPDCAYGFILCPRDEENPRNIYTNACQHTGKKWVLNVDLEDFFHQITQKRLKKMLSVKPFHFSENVIEVLSRICCCDGRLPMGAPTSPILSNMASLDMDHRLMNLAQDHKWTYTRYADDLTFSADKKLSATHLAQIKDIIEGAGFGLNTKKLVLQHGKDKPEVTGLILLKDKPDVSQAFLKTIKQDIRVLDAISSYRMMERNIFTHKPAKKLRRSIQGEINFVSFIRGKDHKSVRKLQARLNRSTQTS